MREMLKHAAIDDLHKLLDTTLAADTADGSEADLLYAIVDELVERGELQPTTETEKAQSYAALMRRIDAGRQSQATHGTANRSPWHKSVIKDAQEELSGKRRRQRKLATAAVSLVVVILLTNVITSKAANFDFLGGFFRWTGQAIYSLFNQEPAEAVVENSPGEWQPLYELVKEKDIPVMLPSSIPVGASFKNLDIIFDDDPFVAGIWFRRESDEFSLKIDGSQTEDIGSRAEADGYKQLDTIRHNDMEFSVYGNEGRLIVVWAQNGYQLVLQGDLTVEEAEGVIKSIEE